MAGAGVKGKLTTHVLDTMHGRPAAGMRVELLHVHGDHTHHLTSATTNADGRLDAPLLEGEHFHPGTYILVFEVGAYFEKQGDAATAAFLTSVPVQFQVADADAHYHVPLLVSPYAYSTYRGS
ncbi:MAG: hydroxyisourate hydrolase [Cucumibacter sp.]